MQLLECEKGTVSSPFSRENDDLISFESDDQDEDPNQAQDERSSNGKGKVTVPASFGSENDDQDSSESDDRCEDLYEDLYDADQDERYIATENFDINSLQSKQTILQRIWFEANMAGLELSNIPTSHPDVARFINQERIRHHKMELQRDIARRAGQALSNDNTIIAPRYKFVALDALDPDWREKWGEELKSMGIQDDQSILENQDFIGDYIKQQHFIQSKISPANPQESRARPPPPSHSQSQPESTYRPQRSEPFTFGGPSASKPRSFPALIAEQRQETADRSPAESDKRRRDDDPLIGREICSGTG